MARARRDSSATRPRSRNAPPAVTAAPRRRHAELAQQILEHIRQSRFSRGHHLTEEGLAEMFGVSRTPVRAALRLLAAQKLLEVRRNQGFFVARSAKEIERAEIELPRGADEDLYLKIAEAHFDNRLPNTITEAALLRRYAVGRPLLLKVLARMSQEGLVRRSPGQGWIFQPILNTTESIGASYRFRLAIEPAGIREADFRLRPGVIRRLRRVHEELLDARARGGTAGDLFEVDALFHESLAEASGNTFIHQAVQHQNRLRRLGEYRSYADEQRLATWCREHLAILAALERDDRESAARLMAQHLGNAQTFGLAAGGPA